MESERDRMRESLRKREIQRGRRKDWGMERQRVNICLFVSKTGVCIKCTNAWFNWNRIEVERSKTKWENSFIATIWDRASERGEGVGTSKIRTLKGQNVKRFFKDDQNIERSERWKSEHQKELWKSNLSDFQIWWSVNYLWRKYLWRFGVNLKS